MFHTELLAKQPLVFGLKREDCGGENLNKIDAGAYIMPITGEVEFGSLSGGGEGLAVRTISILE